MSKASLELGGGNWAAKDGNLLGYAVGDTSGKYIPREFTFSRGADIGATRVNKDGLVEKYRENQFTYSNDFRSSLHWGHAGLAAYYGPNSSPQNVPDGEQGYDGSGGASFILSNTNTTPPTSVHQFNTLTPNIAAVQTFSIYAKALGYKWLVIRTDSTTMESYFDLENGEVGTVESDVIEAKMVDAGNGWWRCFMTVNSDVLVSSVAFGMSDGDNNRDFAGSRDEGGTNRGGIYVMDAQWERGLVLTDYLESGSTTGKAGVLDNLPRIDYTSGSAQLLMEPSRTNYVDQSEYFSDWTTQNSSVTDSDTTSPDGSNNAAKFLASGSGDVNHQLDSASATIPSGAVSASIFAKKGNTDFVRLRLSGTTKNIRAWFDLSNGNPGAVDDGGTSSMTPMGDGWYRCTVTEAGNTSTSAILQVFINESDGQTTWVADGDEYIYIYGAQLEAGSYATSYIPNYGTALGVTRNFDYFADESYNDVLGNGDLSVLVDFDYDAPVREGYTTSFSAYSGNDVLGIKGSSYKNLQVYAAGNFSGEINFNAVEQATRIKALIRTNGTTVELFFNGAKDAETITFVGSLPYAWDEFRVTGSNSLLAKFNRIAIFTESLSDAECIALTTV